MSLSTYIVAAIAYLLGSIPFGYLLVRAFTGADVRNVGSGNIGATNVARTGRKGLAIATLFLDAAKGYLAVVVAPLLTFLMLHAAAPGDGRHLTLRAIAALFAIVGHIFTFWLRFKGGKGVATGLGAFLSLAPLPAMISLAIFVIVLLLTRFVSLGSIIGSGLFPLVFWAVAGRRMTPAIFIISAISAFLIVYRHKENIHRLVTGAENRFGARKA